MIRGALRPFGLAALLLTTSGCVAAAIPVVAGGVLARRELAPAPPAQVPGGALATPPAATPPPPVVEVAPGPALAPDLAGTELPAMPDSAAPPAAAELPPVPPAQGPRSAMSGDAPARSDTSAAIQAFAAYAVAAGSAPPSFGPPRQSALIDPATLISGPRRLACKAQPLAVAVDLDPARSALDLDDPPAPAAGLAEALSAIRAAGVTVFWTSALPLDRADRVYAVLRATGLDLDGTDRLLLVRKPGETVQQRRLAAARDWCFIALAGDRPGDFEEALDYLRDPAGPIAQAMDPLKGAGWFLIPTPIN